MATATTQARPSSGDGLVSIDEPAKPFAPLPVEPRPLLSEAEQPVVEAIPLVKSAALNQSLEHRPPALADRHTDLRADPDRQRRYATRAARAQRLNQRLSQHIEELEARLANARGAEESAILDQLSQLRANLTKRQDLERAAFPAPASRAGS